MAERYGAELSLSNNYSSRLEFPDCRCCISLWLSLVLFISREAPIQRFLSVAEAEAVAVAIALSLAELFSAKAQQLRSCQTKLPLSLNLAQVGQS